MSPMGPSSSTSVPKGCSELMGYNKDMVRNVCSRVTASTYVTLDASDEQLVRVGVRVGDEVERRLLRRNSDERHAFVSGLEPDDFRALNGTTRLVTAVTLALAALRLLLLLGRRRRRTKEAERAGE
jgi:hypothetical protein